MKLSKFLLSASLISSVITPIFAMDDDGSSTIPLQMLLGGGGGSAQQESILALLHETVSTGGEYPKLSDMKVVFDESIKYTAKILGDNVIITGELTYAPFEPVKDFTMSLAQAEKKGGVFNVFADRLKRNLLQDHKDLLPENLAKQSLKAEENYKLALDLVKITKDQNSTLITDVLNAKKQKDAVEAREEQADELLKSKIANGIAEFKQVYSVAANPQKIFGSQRDLIKGGKSAKNTAVTSLLIAAHSNKLLRHGYLSLSLKSEIMTEEHPVEIMIEEQPIQLSPPQATTTDESTLRFDSSSMDLDDLVTLIEGAIVAQLEETISLVENAFLSDKQATGMHS